MEPLEIVNRARRVMDREIAEIEAEIDGRSQRRKGLGVTAPDRWMESRRKYLAVLYLQRQADNEVRRRIRDELSLNGKGNDEQVEP